MDRISSFWRSSLQSLKIPKIGPKTLESLQKAGISTVRDILLCFPLRFKRKIGLTDLRKAQEGDEVYVEGLIIQRSDPPPQSRRPLKVVLQTPEKEYLDIVFFRYHEWTAKKLQLGKRVRVLGKIQMQALRWQMAHPEIDEVFLLSDQVQPHIEPVYSDFQNVPKSAIFSIIKRVFDQYDQLTSSREGCFLRQSLQIVHGLCQPQFYGKHEQLYQEALDFLAFWEGVAYFKQFREQLVAKQESTARCLSTGLLTEYLLQHLPFELTAGQKRVWLEIQNDMNQSAAMQRLVQGDVGCGKTILAFLALTTAVDSGSQAVLMAPTELLAVQHYQNLKKMIADRCTVELLTGSVSGSQRKYITEGIASGLVKIVIGTQAVFQDSVDFSDLGLVVIDEQQRFGVNQRAALLQKSRKNAVHCLTLTATPIPRTLSLALFGQMGLSSLKEKPAGRAVVQTYLTPSTKYDLVLKSVNNCVQKGQLVYWICPLIDESDVLNVSAAEKSFARLKKEPLMSTISIGLMHGRMSIQERQEILKKFYEGEYQVLVSTLVIEVGIDHPLATLIVIESPDRLGLSQLHQLRGRVGRSDLKSYCLLLYDRENITEKGMERLEALCQTHDGFELSEMDLKFRGPGEFLGAKQSGFCGFKIFSFEKHFSKIHDIFKKIETISPVDRERLETFFQYTTNTDYWEQSATKSAISSQ